jgi:hypothetical protein
MKLSEYTLTVLKNFSTINSGLVLLPGGIQKTMAPEESIVAEAELDDIIDSKFGIYDLNQFLGNVTTLNEPELSFNGKTVTMNDGSMALTYYACDPSIIPSPPEDRSITIASPDIEFDLSNAALAKLKKLADMNSLPHLSIVGKNGEVRLQAHERKNDTSNHASTKIADYDGVDFLDTFKSENFKMIPDDYHVKVKHGAFAQFVSKTKNLKYTIAMEI